MVSLSELVTRWYMLHLATHRIYIITPGIKQLLKSEIIAKHRKHNFNTDALSYYFRPVFRHGVTAIRRKPDIPQYLR